MLTQFKSEIRHPDPISLPKKTVDELELKFELDSTTNPEAFLRELIGPVSDIETKEKIRLIIDTQQLDLQKAGLDGLIEFKAVKGKLKQRFKTHSAVDQEGIMHRTEYPATISKNVSGKLDDTRIVPLTPADLNIPVNRDVQSDQIRTLGVVNSTSYKCQIAMKQGLVNLKVDELIAKPLFEGANEVTLFEFEIDNEDDNYEAVLAFKRKLKEIHPSLKVIERSKHQQILSEWAEPLEKVKSSKLEKPNMNHFSLSK